MLHSSFQAKDSTQSSLFVCYKYKNIYNTTIFYQKKKKTNYKTQTKYFTFRQTHQKKKSDLLM